MVSAGRGAAALQQRAGFHFPASAVREAPFGFVKRLLPLLKGNGDILQRRDWVFFFLNIVSGFQSDITAAETHDSHLDGHVLKQAGLAALQEAFFAVLKVLHA